VEVRAISDPHNQFLWWFGPPDLPTGSAPMANRPAPVNHLQLNYALPCFYKRFTYLLS